MSVGAESAVDFSPAERRDIAWIRIGLGVIAICLSVTVALWAVLLQRDLQLDVSFPVGIGYMVVASCVCLLGLAGAVSSVMERQFSGGVQLFLLVVAAAVVWPLLAACGIVWAVVKGKPSD